MRRTLAPIVAPLLVAGLVLGAAVVAGRADREGATAASADAAPAAPADPAPASAPVAQPAPEPIPGVVLTAGAPLGSDVWHVRLGLDPSTALDRVPAVDRDPPHDPALGTLAITDAVEREPGTCGAELRRVVGIDLGADGSPRIDEALLALARSTMAEAEWITTLGDDHCADGGVRPWAYQDVAEVPCAVPDGRPHRCLEIAVRGDGGTVVARPVIDVRAGRVVGVEELVATVGGFAEGARPAVTDARCGAGGGCGTLPATLWPIPSADGLTIILEPDAPSADTETLFVPWRVMTPYPIELHAPPTAEAMPRAPRPTPTAVTVRGAPVPWFGRLGVDRLIPMERIPAALADPAVPAGLGPLAVTGAVERERRYCAAERRHVVGVDVGPGAAAGRIEAALVAAAADLFRFGEWITEYDEEWCLPYGDRRPWSYQELTEEPCELPGGPAVRCFTLDQWTYHEGDGGAPFVLHQATYDVATGAQVPVERILAAAGGDPATAVARTRAVLCRPDVAAELFESPLGGCSEGPLTRAHPTATGVWLGFTSEELGITSDRMREVFVPWAEIATAEVG